VSAGQSHRGGGQKKGAKKPTFAALKIINEVEVPVDANFLDSSLHATQPLEVTTMDLQPAAHGRSEASARR